MAFCLLFFHDWHTVERIGFVSTERCTRCRKTRVRVC